MMSVTNELEINQYEITVHLGVSSEERAHAQKIWLDFSLRFTQSLRALETDVLADTICYHRLLSEITQHLEHKSFCLIEHLTQDIFQFIKKNLEHPATLSLTITKKPAIEGLTHVNFTLRDIE